LYGSFNKQETNIKGEFNKTIDYKKYDSITGLYEVQYKCFFNKIEVDSTATIEEEAINLGAYIHSQFFYFSHLINSEKRDDSKAFIDYLLKLRNNNKRYQDFDLYSLMSKNEINSMSNDKIYRIIKKEFDSLDHYAKFNAYGIKVLKGNNLKIVYHKNFKNYSQCIVGREKLNNSNFIDLNKSVKTTNDYVKLFEKLKSTEVIYLTTTLNKNEDLILFNEVYFNKQYIKTPDRLVFILEKQMLSLMNLNRV